MKILRLCFVIFLGAALFSGCSQDDQHQSAHQQESTEYYCPMHPQVVSPTPGVCPICHMDLVKRGTDDTMDEADESLLTLNSGRQVLANVSTVAVQRRSIAPTVRAYSSLQIPELNSRIIAAKFNGRIERLHAATTGELIRKNEVLAEIYSPDIVQAQHDLLIALERPSSDLIASARQKLELMGFTADQIDELQKRKSVEYLFSFRSPYAGTIVKKNIVEGAYFNEGTVLYEIADLSEVWGVSEVPQSDIQQLRVGVSALLTVEGSLRTIKGSVIFISPVINPQTRTVEVRTLYKNTNGILRPNMWGTVEFSTGQRSMLIVPKEAVLFTGKRTIVWVKSGEKEFTPHDVRVGQRVEDSYQIISGVAEGTIIAATGGYLLDSESQLRSGNTPSHQHQGAAGAKKSNSDKMLHQNSDGQTETAKKIFNAYCPVLGGPVDPDVATVEYKGKNIGFCCPGCDADFKKDPERYLMNLSADGRTFVGEK